MQALGRKPVKDSAKPIDDPRNRAGKLGQPLFEATGMGLTLCAPGQPAQIVVSCTSGARLKVSTAAAGNSRHARSRYA